MLQSLREAAPMRPKNSEIGIPASIALNNRLQALPIVVFDAATGRTLNNTTVAGAGEIEQLRKNTNNLAVWLQDRGGPAPDVDDQIKAKRLSPEQAAEAKAAQAAYTKSLRSTATRRPQPALRLVR